jgi:5-methylcytosine-specific restriction endonuclease McrA
MSYKTLILNSDYTILHVCSWEKAISLLYIKRVAVEVDFYKDTKVKSGKRSYPIPAVIALKKYVKHNFIRKKKFSRATVLKRDGYTCMYCGVKKSGGELTLDHIIPKSKFRNGENPTFYENVTTSCKPCNAKKADKSCAEAKMFPIQKPYTPKYYDIILADVRKIPNEWTPYLPKH